MTGETVIQAKEAQTALSKALGYNEETIEYLLRDPESLVSKTLKARQAIISCLEMLKQEAAVNSSVAHRVEEQQKIELGIQTQKDKAKQEAEYVYRVVQQQNAAQQSSAQLKQKTEKESENLLTKSQVYTKMADKLQSLDEKLYTAAQTYRENIQTVRQEHTQSIVNALVEAIEDADFPLEPAQQDRLRAVVANHQENSPVTTEEVRELSEEILPPAENLSLREQKSLDKAVYRHADLILMLKVMGLLNQLFPGHSMLDFRQAVNGRAVTNVLKLQYKACCAARDESYQEAQKVATELRGLTIMLPEADLMRIALQHFLGDDDNQPAAFETAVLRYQR